jgi:hypothetical protein
VLVINLLRTTRDEGEYELLLAKRGKRAGATYLEGDRTNLLYLKHSDTGILWEQRPKPFIVLKEPKAKPKRKAKAAPKPKPTKEELSKLRKEAGTKQIKDLNGLIARIAEPMTKSEIYKLAEANGHGSAHTLRKNWNQVEIHLVKTKNRYQQKSIS